MTESKEKSYPYLFKKSKREQEKLRERRQKAREEAEKAASILKEEFKAEKVWLFGSLLQEGKFHERSDIDLAAKGIPPEKFYKALGKIMRKVEGFKVDLVDMDDARESLRERIKEEGEVI